MLYIELGRFKQVNDSLGHAAGDDLLLEIARQMKQEMRQGDIVARLGATNNGYRFHGEKHDGAMIGPVA